MWGGECERLCGSQKKLEFARFPGAWPERAFFLPFHKHRLGKLKERHQKAINLNKPDLPLASHLARINPGHQDKRM